jgi:hypothetical protein
LNARLFGSFDDPFAGAFVDAFADVFADVFVDVFVDAFVDVFPSFLFVFQNFHLPLLKKDLNGYHPPNPPHPPD